MATWGTNGAQQTAFVEIWYRFWTSQNRLQRNEIWKCNSRRDPRVGYLLYSDTLSYYSDDQQQRQLEGWIWYNAKTALVETGYEFEHRSDPYLFCKVAMTVLLGTSVHFLRNSSRGASYTVVFNTSPLQSHQYRSSSVALEIDWHQKVKHEIKECLFELHAFAEGHISLLETYSK